MDKTERLNLIRALEAASNAFSVVMREHGYELSHVWGDLKTRSIYKANVLPVDKFPLGNLKIDWKLNKED